MNGSDTHYLNQYKDLILSIKTNFLSHKYNDDRLVVLGESGAGKTLFLKELISYLRENKKKFFCFSASHEIRTEKFIPAQDKLINPWISQQFILPTMDFTEYQSNIIPVLNDFIHLREHKDDYNLFIEYPLSNDSVGNRFVLNSLINLAVINHSWLIIDELNFEDTLRNLGNALNTRSNVVIAINNPLQESYLHLHNWDQNLIAINNNLKVLRITPKFEY